MWKAVKMLISHSIRCFERNWFSFPWKRFYYWYWIHRKNALKIAICPFTTRKCIALRCPRRICYRRRLRARLRDSPSTSCSTNVWFMVFRRSAKSIRFARPSNRSRFFPITNRVFHIENRLAVGGVGMKGKNDACRWRSRSQWLLSSLMDCFDYAAKQSHE